MPDYEIICEVTYDTKSPYDLIHTATCIVTAASDHEARGFAGVFAAQHRAPAGAAEGANATASWRLSAMSRTASRVANCSIRWVSRVIDKMGLKGNKSGEMSVSNALTALTKGNQVVRRAGKYIASMG